MVAHATVCVRRLAGGCRAQLVRYGRFLANPNVTVAALLDGWGEQTARAATSRPVLAIQDTSAVHFRTTAGRRRGLGEVGHGNIHGLLVHAMLALDAATGSCLGLVGGRVGTRSGHVRVMHNRRALADKEFGTLAHHRRACQGSVRLPRFSGRLVGLRVRSWSWWSASRLRRLSASGIPDPNAVAPGYTNPRCS